MTGARVGVGGLDVVLVGVGGRLVVELCPGVPACLAGEGLLEGVGGLEVVVVALDGV